MRTRSIDRAVLLTLAFLVAIVAGPPAWGAAPETVQSVTVRVVNDSQGGVVLVSGELPSGAALPAQVRLAVPKGVEIVWAGEILGGDPSKDPDAKYERTSGDGFDVIDMTLKQARIGQVEYRDAAAVVKSGQSTTSKISWTSPVNASTGRVAIEVPQGAQVSDAGGAQPDNSGFYTKTINGVKAGDKLELQVVYAATTAAPGGQTPPVPQQPGSPAPTGSQAAASPVTLILVAGLLVGGTLFALRYVNRKQQEQ